MKKNNEVKNIDREILIHRYCYYVQCLELISDYEYDQLEAKAKLNPNSVAHEVGSDMELSYPEDIRQEAKQRLIAAGYSEQDLV